MRPGRRVARRWCCGSSFVLLSRTGQSGSSSSWRSDPVEWTAARRVALPTLRSRRSGRPFIVAAGFVLPSLLPLLAFSIGPMAASMLLSLYKWDLLRPARWFGVENYRNLAADPDFHAAVGHTLYFIAGYLPLVFVGGLGIALALNQRLRFSGAFRTIYFLPVVTSWVVVAFMWKWLLNPQSGLINYALSLLGIHGPGWWTDPNWAMPSIILA